VLLYSRQALPIDIAVPIDYQKYKEFRDTYYDWIHSSNQPVKGVDNTAPVVVSGVTDAFNQLYGLYKTIGIFKGEYGYHQLVNKNVTHDLTKADCIVVSHPFSATGNCAMELLKIADKYNKPIFVDCAFFGICSDIDFDFSKFRNIHSVCFSLSKTFGTGLHRVGMMFTKDNFPCKHYDRWHYPLITQANLHLDLILNRSPDWAYDTYRNAQLKVCEEYNLIPSSTVIFGLDYFNRYNDCKRDDDINRVCISEMLNPNVKKFFQNIEKQ
tara:strand:+ start:791 stop:1597 length:807 start_codon:yes stop_codon:yes gene_type:complete